MDRRTFLGAAGALWPAVSSCAATEHAWQDQGDARASNTAQLNLDPRLALRHDGAEAYKVTSYRIVDGLPPGSYTLRAQARSSGGQPSVFAFARVPGWSLARTHPMAGDERRPLVIRGIPVEDGSLAIGLHSDAAGGQWAELMDIELVREPTPRPFLSGGDVSVLSWMERAGAHYRDRQGRVRDVLEILRDAGNNLARLRLYDSPGSGHGADGYYWPEGCQDLPDLLALARRVSAAGMQIELTLHYSDFWTNSRQQTPPAAWRDRLASAAPDARLDTLCQLVADRTREVLRAMKAQGTPPAFVSLGNEIESGLLYPYGAVREGNWPAVARLLRAGQGAVKAELPAAKVILHLDDAGNDDKYHAWFDAARAHGVAWDVIGASYYPFWTRKTVEQVARFARDITARYDTDLMIMEAGFNFSPTLPDGDAGQLSDNGPYPASMSSPSGQRDFVDALFNGVKGVDRVIGFLYWDPIMIGSPGVGWALREGTGKAAPNIVSNTTLFDFEGRALPVLDVWRDHASAARLPKAAKG
jgi:arabinogalactan endo-1,4-beta-galactosidase